MDDKIKDLNNLNKEIRKCRKCRLWESRKNVLCGEGNSLSKLMLIAQAPGEKEDRVGRMFIGPSGKKLDELLRDAKIDRKKIYMTNLIKCFLPKYRKPKEDEIKTCSQYLDKEIALINPTIISPLGYYATRYIFKKYGILIPESKKEFSKVYGKIFSSQNKRILPLKHPTALLYNDSIKEEMIKNYKKLKKLSR